MSVIGLKTKNGVNYSGLSSYDDTELRTLINGKVSKQAGKGLISTSEITRLAGVSNYDDSELRQAISSSSANITQAVLSCEIPQDYNVQFLDVTIKLCPNPDMQTGLIQINNITHHSIMHIALDSQFVPLSDYYYEDEQGSPKIPYSYFTGTLTVRLSAETVEGFNPNIPWYVVAVWSNGTVSSDSKMIQFLHSGFCEMPRVTTSTTTA